jgi:DNA-binding LacI/PurR family transcriptional regulator
MSRQRRKANSKAGSTRAGLVAIAEVVGVSPSTVSNAYNRPDQLSPALRERILRTAAELGYPGPDPLARNLRRGRAGALGVLFEEQLPYPFDDPHAVRVLQGVAEGIAEQGLALVLVPGSPDRATHGEAIRNAAVDGFILHSLVQDEPLLQIALERQLPAVIIDAPPVDGLDFVGIDDRTGAATATDHLLALGHTNLGILTFRLTARIHPGPVPLAERRRATSTIGRDRLQGCADSISAAGLNWAEVPVQECSTTSVEAGRVGTRALLERAPDITGIVAFSDRLALGAKLEASHFGMSVPGDLSIVGFDDVLPAVDDLTTINQPQLDKGRIAAERLIDRLAGGKSVPRREILPTSLVVRGSTGPPRAR